MKKNLDAAATGVEKTWTKKLQRMEIRLTGAYKTPTVCDIFNLLGLLTFCLTEFDTCNFPCVYTVFQADFLCKIHVCI